MRLHWILPSTMFTCLLSQRKPSNWLLTWMLRGIPWLISSSLAGSTSSRKSHTHYIPTDNTVNQSLLKMDLCSVEKCSSSLHQKGRRSLVLYTNHTKTIPKHSCLPVVVSSGLVLTRPLRKLFGNVKHAWMSDPECCYTTHTKTYTFTSLADMFIGHLYIGWCGLPHPSQFLFKGNPGTQPLCRPKQLCQNHPHPGEMVL